MKALLTLYQKLLYAIPSLQRKVPNLYQVMPPRQFFDAVSLHEPQ